MKKQNYIFMILLSVIIIFLVGMLVKRTFYPIKDGNNVNFNMRTNETAQDITNKEYSTDTDFSVPNNVVVESSFAPTNTLLENISSKMENEITPSFNTEFQNYEGTQGGTSIRTLIQSVIMSNISEVSHSISIEFGEEIYIKEDELISLKGSIITTKSYHISFTYDTNGYINTIVIAEA